MSNYAFKPVIASEAKQSRKFADFSIFGLLRFARNDGDMHVYSMILPNETAPCCCGMPEPIEAAPMRTESRF